MMNGYFFLNTVDFSSIENHIISCFFINCSNRAICIQNDESSIIINYCSFVRCTYFNASDKCGGSIYTNCYRFSISKTRFLESGVYQQGIAFYNLAKEESIKMLSIIKNIYHTNSHYCFYTKGIFDQNSNNINVSNLETFYDVGICTNETITWRFMHFESLTARTLFRSEMTFNYFNIVKCSFNSFVFENTITLKDGYIYNVNVTESFSYNQTSSITSIIDCSIIESNLKIPTINVTIENTFSSGNSYECLPNIPILFCNTIVPKSHTAKALAISIFFGCLV